MLDIILDIMGAVLFLGQGIYFLLFAGNWMSGADQTDTPHESRMETRRL
jgi:hypothetical protein